MRRSVISARGSSLSSLVDDPTVQLVAVATGLAAFAGGVGLQVVWLLLLAAAVVNGLVGSPAYGTNPGSGGHGGGGGGTDRPLDPTTVPPAVTGAR